jgi:hypothetical protein
MHKDAMAFVVFYHRLVILPYRFILDSMPYSSQTEAVLAYFDEYTGFNLRKRNDIAELLEAASLLDAADEFNNLIFTGKVVWNLYATLRKTTPVQDGYQSVEQEFTTEIHNLRNRLVFFTTQDAIENETKSRFQEIYLGTGQGTTRNIVDLAHDLARFKDLQSDMARQAAGDKENATTE